MHRISRRAQCRNLHVSFIRGSSYCSERCLGISTRGAQVARVPCSPRGFTIFTLSPVLIPAAGTHFMKRIITRRRSAGKFWTFLAYSAANYVAARGLNTAVAAVAYARDFNLPDRCVIFHWNSLFFFIHRVAWRNIEQLISWELLGSILIILDWNFRDSVGV